ncbi:MAG: hypothetical protein AB8G86_27325 [Saprospiraceae bacterium]
MRISLIILLFIFSITQIKAQCTSIEQLTKNTAAASPTTMVVGGTIIGQSFKACRTGQLTAMTISVVLPIGANKAETTLSVANGAATSSAILHTQPVTLNASGDVEIKLTAPVDIENNRTYTFFLGGAGDPFDIAISSELGDRYTDGTLIQNGTALANFDLFFKLKLGPSVLIPTMSQWGMMIFGLLIFNLAIFCIRRTEQLLLSEELY